jgi:hypothetical protein
MNSDGTNEIDTLVYLPFENANEPIPADANLVLVLVEPRPGTHCQQSVYC